MKKCCDIDDKTRLYICICCGKITCKACTYLNKDGKRECQECKFLMED